MSCYISCVISDILCLMLESCICTLRVACCVMLRACGVCVGVMFCIYECAVWL